MPWTYILLDENLNVATGTLVVTLLLAHSSILVYSLNTNFPNSAKTMFQPNPPCPPCRISRQLIHITHIIKIVQKTHYDKGSKKFMNNIGNNTFNVIGSNKKRREKRN